MFVRKKTKLRLAYISLTFTAVAFAVSDALSRNEGPQPVSSEMSTPTQAPALPIAMTPLADSPFPEARPQRSDTGTILASSETSPVKKRAKSSAAQDVFFLTATVKVESKSGPVALLRGTRVRVLRQQEGMLLVRHNRTDFLVEKSQVTDDVTTLAAFARSSS